MSYAAGGAGASMTLATEGLGSSLGRYWSHRWAERILLAPDETKVLLVTRHATFREFSGLSMGVYQTAAPSDEYRTLIRTASGWELVDLEGTVVEFGADGLWVETRDRNGNAWIGTYTAGQLASVDHPDGRREDFTYHPGGLLASITEVGVDGTTTRTWIYTWSGPDLARIDRPDGTAWRFVYGDLAHPGYLTRMILEGNDGPPASERVEAAFTYDAQGNAATFWQGDDDPMGPGAVGKWELSFDDPQYPGETQVTDPLGAISTHTLIRDTRSTKARVSRSEDDCPLCGSGPNAVRQFGDPQHPLLPTQETDGRGHVTQMTYTSEGRLASRTEAVGTPEERTTSWEYDLTYPALVTRVEEASTAGFPDLRVTVNTYDGSGDLLEERIEGLEDGSAFSLATTRTYSSSGQPATTDPPGYGTADVTSWTYDSTRGDLVPLTSADPLIGTTTYGHDPFNRRQSVTDPNGVSTTTVYDALDRMRFRTQMGDPVAVPPVPDLVTEHRYDAFGDLFQTVLPEGNVVEYTYDGAGRLTAIERKPDDQPTSRGERTVYQLDDAGNRAREEHQRWDGAAWQTESFTDFVYESRCRLSRRIDAAGGVTEYAYDCEGNLEKVWDANHPSNNQTNPATQTYAYDALDRMISATQPWSGSGGGTAVTTYGYDVQDHLTSVTDAEGNVTTYEYSDRDLLIEEISPASGTTSHLYNEHGELISTTDARGITVIRTIDALDRVTVVTYPDASLNTTYTYDDPGVPFSIGRLTATSRHGASIDYETDRFGRLVRDGNLAYTLDGNGNRTGIGYPGAVTALTAYDYVDRPISLTVQRPGQPDQVVASGATYAPSGPLTGLTLGNGLVETRPHDGRYHPDRITLAGASTLLDWDYTTDAVGNPTAIADLLTPADSRTYAYQDHHYFLTQGDGPWGDLSWTYDRIGNRLTETRDGVTDTYAYLLNGASPQGNTPILDQVTRGAGGLDDYTFGPAGHLTQLDAAGDLTLYTSDAEGRLSRIERPSAPAFIDFDYDGRSFMKQGLGESTTTFGPESDRRTTTGAIFADSFESGDVCAWSGNVGDLTNACPKPQTLGVQPLYDSAGILHGKTSDAEGDLLVFYLAGRPVAVLESAGVDETWIFLTTDHLGTPVAATDLAGAELWAGGFEPFGSDSFGGQSAGVFLRFPGQWADLAWTQNSLGPNAYYNVHRWYFLQLGRYMRADPVGLRSGVNLYSYALQRPLIFIDPEGLKVLKCCRKVRINQAVNLVAGLFGLEHCFIKTDILEAGLGPEGDGGLPACPLFTPTAVRDHSGQSADSDCVEVPGVDEDCVNAALQIGSPNGKWTPGNNCNSFASRVLFRCRDRCAVERRLSSQGTARCQGFGCRN